MLYKLSEWH